MSTWGWREFQEQFAEDDDERRERWRKTRAKKMDDAQNVPVVSDAGARAPGHTPGPWTVTETYPPGQLTLYSETARGPGKHQLRSVCWMVRVTEADARLIAAAPDLLAALEDIIARNEIQHWFNLDQARAAVTKAQGTRAEAVPPGPPNARHQET